MSSKEDSRGTLISVGSLWWTEESFILCLWGAERNFSVLWERGTEAKIRLFLCWGVCLTVRVNNPSHVVVWTSISRLVLQGSGRITIPKRGNMGPTIRWWLLLVGTASIANCSHVEVTLSWGGLSYSILPRLGQLLENSRHLSMRAGSRHHLPVLTLISLSSGWRELNVGLTHIVILSLLKWLKSLHVELSSNLTHSFEVIRET